MNTQTKLIFVLSVILAFAVGIIAGRGVAGPRGGMHRMPDGTMMSNNGDMTAMMHDMNAALVGKTGDAFDREFLTQMVVHHEGAVDMAKKVLEVSKRPELIRLANGIIAAQTGEIQTMNAWKAAWFK